MTTHELRLDDLESRLAFQDDTIAALNDALVEQQVRLVRLEQQLERMTDMLREQGEDPEVGPEPPPPHY